MEWVFKDNPKSLKRKLEVTRFLPPVFNRETTKAVPKDGERDLEKLLRD